MSKHCTREVHLDQRLTRTAYRLTPDGNYNHDYTSVKLNQVCYRSSFEKPAMPYETTMITDCTMPIIIVMGVIEVGSKSILNRQRAMLRTSTQPSFSGENGRLLGWFPRLGWTSLFVLSLGGMDVSLVGSLGGMDLFVVF
jgi:hypothetical protein